LIHSKSQLICRLITATAPSAAPSRTTCSPAHTARITPAWRVIAIIEVIVLSEWTWSYHSRLSEWLDGERLHHPHFRWMWVVSARAIVCSPEVAGRTTHMVNIAWPLHTCVLHSSDEDRAKMRTRIEGTSCISVDNGRTDMD